MLVWSRSYTSRALGSEVLSLWRRRMSSLGAGIDQEMGMNKMAGGWVEPNVTVLCVTPRSPTRSSKYHKIVCWDWISCGF